jgi:magnesium transporter
MLIKITKDFVEQIQEYIQLENKDHLINQLNDFHYADIAELLRELEIEEVIYLFKILSKEKTSNALTELEDFKRERILKELTSVEIAENIDNLDTDDAVNIVRELPTEQREEVISNIEDEKHAEEIIELLNYDEKTAGGLMAKELVKVNENWNVLTCVKQMRLQAESVKRVHSIYVINDQEKLLGRLSLKDLLTQSTKTSIKDVYIRNVDYVSTSESGEEVAKIMRKYNLEAIPVVDELGKLVGRITIDDIVDLIAEYAEKDYQMAAGLVEDVEANDSIWDLTRARLPWLFLGLLGGVGAARIMGLFEGALAENAVLFMFTPLIAAMAGNVGVQSSAIIVQGLANNNLKGGTRNRLLKEFTLALLNGAILATVLFVLTLVWKKDISTALAISLSLFSVIIVAGIVGTFIPLFLNKRGIDPAIATGPFITTSNDIFGILIYFWIAKMILGF